MSRKLSWAVAAIAVLFLLGAWSVLERPASAAGRAQQFTRVSLALVLFPLLASVASFGAAGAYGPGDRERTVWLALGAACLAQCVSRAAFAYHQLRLGQPAPFPSVADVFTAASGLLVLVGLATELGLIRDVLYPRQVLALAALALLVLLVGGAIFLAPLLQAGVRGIREATSLVFSVAGILLVPLGLLPAVVFRGGLLGYAWLLVSAALACMGLWVLWFSNAVFYGLWFEGHPSNVVHLLAFALLAVGALVSRTVTLAEA